MNDKLIRNKLSNFNEKQTCNNWNCSILLLAKYEAKQENEETIQASPKWGKKGVGTIIPLALY